MTKEKYIRQLKGKLRFHLSGSEIDEIAADISELYDSNMEAGLTDEQIVTKIGTPTETANELINENNAANSVSVPVIAKYAAVLLIFFVILAVEISGSPVHIIAEFIAAAVIICFILNGKFYTFKANPLLFISSILLLASAALFPCDVYYLIFCEKKVWGVAVCSLMLASSAASGIGAVSVKSDKTQCTVTVVLSSVCAVISAVGLIKTLSVSAGSDNAVMGDCLNTVSLILLMMSAVNAVINIVCKNALSLSSLFMVLSAVALTVNTRTTLMSLDPESTESMLKIYLEQPSSNDIYLFSGIVLAAASFICALVLRLTYRRKSKNG